jgi:hypothetical protein
MPVKAAQVIAATLSRYFGRMLILPRAPSEALVTEFLRDALAVDSLRVPELEAMARSAGLLGEGQRITHAKVFKKAKKSLGIRSVRNGFGDAGEWLWQLERQPASPVSKPLAQPPLSIEDTYAEALDLEEGPADVRARRIPSSCAPRFGKFQPNLPPNLWGHRFNGGNFFNFHPPPPGGRLLGHQ